MIPVTLLIAAHILKTAKAVQKRVSRSGKWQLLRTNLEDQDRHWMAAFGRSPILKLEDLIGEQIVPSSSSVIFY